MSNNLTDSGMVLIYASSLDIGCGTGMSGDAITEMGHQFVGVDISENMLRKQLGVQLLPSPHIMPLSEMAVEREAEGDFVQQDMGQGLPFRAGVFDGAIRWVLTSKKP